MNFAVQSSVDSATVNAIVKAVDPAFSALATLTEKVVELAIRQNYVYATWDAIVAGVALVVFIICVCIWLAHRKKADFESYHGNSHTYFVIFAWVAMGCCAILFAVEACWVAARLMNPEYMAIKDAIQMIQGTR